MSAILIPKSGVFPPFQSGAHADQIGVNDVPANAPGYEFGAPDYGRANHYIAQSPPNTYGFSIYNHQLQTNRAYDGSDTVRSHRIACLVQTDVDNNDPSIPDPNDIYGWGICSVVNVGRHGPSYGSSLAISALLDVFTEQNGNEYALYHGSLVAGTYDNHVAGGAHYWMTDISVYGPVAAQPGLLYGHSVQIANFYNGSPSVGASVGCRITSTMPGAGSAYKRYHLNDMAQARATCYPVDVGVGVGGATDGGTLDSFTNAVQIGGANLMDQAYTTMAGDQGQVGRGVVVKAKNAGTSCTRLGAFVSEGTGEAGGLIFGLDTNDANRASVFRPAGGVLRLSGKLSISGEASSGVPTPANVVGKFPLYDATGTLIGYVPVYSTL